MKRMLLAAGLAASVVTALAALPFPARAQAPDWKHIRVATEGAFPPFNMHAPDGKIIGFEPDLLAVLCKHMNAECELIPQDWNGIIPGLNAGKYDAIMDGMSITPKREEVIAFSVPYTNSPTTFEVLSDSKLVNLPGTGTRVKLTDEAATRAAIQAMAPSVKGLTIGVQVATIQLDMLNTYLKDVVSIRTYPTTEASMLDLKAGRVDAVTSSMANLITLQEKSNGGLKITGPLFSGGLLGKGSGIGLRKSDTALKEKFDEAIKAAIADGTVKTLALKWFHFDSTPQ